MAAAGEHERLARRLGTVDAVVVGLGSMIGAGAFVAIGPAARAAHGGLLVGLAIAAIVATANALSTAQLAAVHPEAGGAFVYGRRRLGETWGHLAGWGFVCGKTASCAAIALTFGSYVAESAARPLGIAAVAAATALGYRGIQRTAHATRVIVVLVLAALACAVVAAAFGGHADADHLRLGSTAGPYGVLQAAGLLFFAFAGYARIATLGEEVQDPARVIPRAIPIALAVTLVVYAVVAFSAQLAIGPDALASASAPLAAVARAGRLDGLAPVISAGAALASLGVLLNLLAGVSRTTLAMARARELPGWLDAVHPRHRVPHHAELAVAVLVIAVVATLDVRGAIGFSSFCVLAYYAVANAAAWTLTPAERRWPRWVSALGLAGCVVLAATLPVGSVVAGAGVLLAGVAIREVRARARCARRPRD